MLPHQAAPEEPLQPVPPAEAASAAVASTPGDAAVEAGPSAPPQPSAEPESPSHQAAPFAETVKMETPVAEELDIDFDIALAATIRDTETRLAEAEAHLAEQHDAWLRAKAETENMRRRAQEEIAKASRFAAEKFAGAMLPVKDSLEAALASASQTPEKLLEGVELTLKQLTAAFESAGLAEENPLGQKFDPNKHQAIGVAESDAEPNTVVNVLQKGYLLHERVIRPAMVMVSRTKT